MTRRVIRRHDSHVTVDNEQPLAHLVQGGLQQSDREFRRGDAVPLLWLAIDFTGRVRPPD